VPANRGLHRQFAELAEAVSTRREWSDGHRTALPGRTVTTASTTASPRTPDVEAPARPSRPPPVAARPGN
jgi:hypothetical protein